MFQVHNQDVSRSATILDVPFVRQRQSWDCSIACVAMVVSYIAHRSTCASGNALSSPDKPALEKKLEATDDVKNGSGLSSPSHFYEAVRQEQHMLSLQPSPLWTIDVVLLLHAVLSRIQQSESGPEKPRSPVRISNDAIVHRVQMEFQPIIRFYSTCLGPNEALKDEPFYQETFDKDAAAVAASFRRASDLGIECVMHRLTEEEMSERLSEGGSLIICLVDATKFRCARSSSCADTFSSPQAAALECVDRCSCIIKTLGSCCCKLSSHGETLLTLPFAGHFVVLVGFDPVTRHFILRNPSSRVDSMCSCAAETLEQARSSRGTDHDTICVTLGRLTCLS